jgi:sulfur-oxidizing protein SoxY
MQRRDIVRGGSGAALLGLAAGSLWTPPVQAADAPGWNRAAFAAKSLAEVVKALGGAPATESREVSLQAPEIAENGASVRFTAQSSLPNTSWLALVVEENPFALAALFEVPAGTDAQFITHLKMQETSKVYALAKSGDRFFFAVRSVTVTLGGCAS